MLISIKEANELRILSVIKHMSPLTKKGKKIMRNMRKEYGEKAEEVFYATANKGKIKGVHKGKKKK